MSQLDNKLHSHVNFIHINLYNPHNPMKSFYHHLHLQMRKLRHQEGTFSKSLTVEVLNPGNELQSLHFCLSILNFPWSWESVQMWDKCEETRAPTTHPCWGLHSYLPAPPPWAPPYTYLGSTMSLGMPGNLYPHCHPWFTNGETEAQGGLEAPMAT